MTEIGARLAVIERLLYWTLGLIGGLILALLTGAFAIIASLLQLHQRASRREPSSASNSSLVLKLI